MHRPFCSRSVLSVMLVVALSISLLSACGNPNDEPGKYRDDGYLGMTQTNPNMQTNPTERSHYEDTQMVRRTLMSLDGIQQVQTFTNGPHVYVYVTPENGLSEAQQEELRLSAERALEYNNPRFDYFVNIR